MVTKTVKKPVELETLKAFGGGLKEVTVALANHPTLLCVGLMGFSKIVLASVPPDLKGHQYTPRNNIRMQMHGLYDGMQSALQILAAVQVAVQVIPAIAGGVTGGLQAVYGAGPKKG